MVIKSTRPKNKNLLDAIFACYLIKSGSARVSESFFESYGNL